MNDSIARQPLLRSAFLEKMCEFTPFLWNSCLEAYVIFSPAESNQTETWASMTIISVGMFRLFKGKVPKQVSQFVSGNRHRKHRL